MRLPSWKTCLKVLAITIIVLLVLAIIALLSIKPFLRYKMGLSYNRDRDQYISDLQMEESRIALVDGEPLGAIPMEGEIPVQQEPLLQWQYYPYLGDNYSTSGSLNIPEEYAENILLSNNEETVTVQIGGNLLFLLMSEMFQQGEPEYYDEAMDVFSFQIESGRFWIHFNSETHSLYRLLNGIAITYRASEGDDLVVFDALIDGGKVYQRDPLSSEGQLIDLLDTNVRMVMQSFQITIDGEVFIVDDIELIDDQMVVIFKRGL
jgi:hypothetical protein